MIALGQLCAVAYELPEFVDMGTSVLWATEALGVDETHPYGNYYRAGAIAPYPKVSTIQLESNYEATEWGGDPKFDAATAKYGKGVSTPSKAQFEELMKVCTIDHSYDYTLRRYVMELTSKVTGNKITLTGAGYWSFTNDHTDSGTIELNTSTRRNDEMTDGYYFSPTAATHKGMDQAVVYRKIATLTAIQLLPVFDAGQLVKASSITLNTKSMIMAVGDIKTLSATIEPTDVSVNDRIWSTSDETVATVSADGEVTAVAAGKCSITVKTTDGTDLSASCDITVTQPTPGMKWVDMGLDLLWGEHEIGASNFIEAGTYYAWGTAENANNWEAAVASAYPVTNITEPFTAVPRDPSDPSKAYDVAKDILGGDWHTPNMDEWNELVANCTMSKATVDGVSCTVFTSKINGNTLYFAPHGYLRETSSSPSMSTSILLQASDAAANNIYKVIDINYPRFDKLARHCFWLVPIRPVQGNPLSSTLPVTLTPAREALYDVYDLWGRKVIDATPYEDACSRLNKGVYLFVGNDGNNIKVSI